MHCFPEDFPEVTQYGRVCEHKCCHFFLLGHYPAASRLGSRPGGWNDSQNDRGERGEGNWGHDIYLINTALISYYTNVRWDTEMVLKLEHIKVQLNIGRKSPCSVSPTCIHFTFLELRTLKVLLGSKHIQKDERTVLKRPQFNLTKDSLPVISVDFYPFKTATVHPQTLISTALHTHHRESDNVNTEAKT